eukprot:765035-Hanusia_phi.AAC.14
MQTNHKPAAPHFAKHEQGIKSVEVQGEDEDELLANLDLDEIVAQHKQGSLSQECANTERSTSSQRPQISNHFSPLKANHQDFPQSKELSAFRQERLNASSPSYNPRTSLVNTPGERNASPEERKRQHLLELQRQKELIERQISALQAEGDADYMEVTSGDGYDRPEPLNRNHSDSFPANSTNSYHSYQGGNQNSYTSSVGSRVENSLIGSYTAPTDSFQTPVHRYSNAYESDPAPYPSGRATFGDYYNDQAANQPLSTFSNAYPQSSPLKLPEQKGGYAFENDQQHLNRVDLFGKSQKFDWTEKLRKINKHVFRNPSFRKHQEEIINSILSGHDCFVLMPTGGGKSLCYQLPALMSPGVTIVISPLVSLMHDQVYNLNLLRIGAFCISANTPMSELEEMYSCLRGVKEGINCQLIYITPEKFAHSQR